MRETRVPALTADVGPAAASHRKADFMTIRDPMKVYRAVWWTLAAVLLIGLGLTAAVSLAGSPDLLGAGVVALLLFALCSPAGICALRRGWRTMRRPSATRMETLARAFAFADPRCMTLPTPPTAPCELTDEQLSREWQTSSRSLRARASSAQKVAIVEERQTYLEEFERRNPSGFAAWLTSEIGASDDLMPYLSKAGVERAAINWDELTRGRD